MKTAWLVVVAVSLALATTGAVAPQPSPRAPLFKAAKTIHREYVITLKDVSQIKVVSQLILSTGRTRNQTARVTNTLTNLLPTIVATLSSEVLDVVRGLDAVKYVEENGQLVLDSHTIQWGLDRIDQPDIPMDYNYDTKFTGQGVNVYVIDTGIKADHIDFGGRAKVHECSAADGVDQSGHGTHVAGIVGSRNYGVAKKTNIHMLEYTDTASVKTMLDCLTVKMKKPAVASMSLGGFPSSFDDFAATFVTTTNVNLVTSAGNSNKDACANAPSGAKEVITVAASTGSDWPYDVNNYGACVDIIAPGVGIISTGIKYATDIRTGTSMACPHVTGALALFMEKEGRHIGYPEGETMLTGMAVKDKIKGDIKGIPNLLLQVV